MDSFQAKIGWERPTKRENKNYHSDQFQPNLEQRISKNNCKTTQKKKKKKKTPFWLIFKPKQVRKRLERVKIKITVPISSYPTRNTEFQKNSGKSSKKLKTPSWLLFMPKEVGTGRKGEKIKMIVSINSYPTRNR